MLCHSPQYSFDILCDSIQFASLARHSKQCITKSLHPRAAPTAAPASLPPPCCFKTSKVRLITILSGDKWLREVWLFVMKPSSWISAESRYCNIFSSHPWTLIVQCRAVCFDVPERIERAPAFPHNWMIFAFILLMEAFLEEKELSSGVTCISTKMKSSRVGGDCTYRGNACLHAYRENRNFRLKGPLQFDTEDKSQSILWPLHTHK